MFDRVSDIGGFTGSGDGDADASDMPDVLREGERSAHVLANDGTIECTKDGRTTKVEPNGDARAYLLVTDERVLCLLGDQPETAEIEIEMTDYVASDVRKGLLSSKLQVVADDEEVVFAPDDGDIDACGEYLEGVASCWADMDDATANARGMVDAFEQRVSDGEAEDQWFSNVKSRLANARSYATRYPEAPERKIHERVAEAETELYNRRVEAWINRIEACYGTIEPALDDGDYDEACHMYAEAAAAVESARNALDDVDEPPADTADRVADLAADLRAVGERFLAETSDACEQALAADDPDVAVESWETAFDRYSAAAEAEWNGHAPVDGDAIELQLTWVTASLLDELDARASALEQRGDDCEDADEAQAYYEDAMAWFERAGEFAVEHPERTPAEFDAAADRVEDKKLEAAGWEFGNA
jgi:tetratricopeptide (TPR) repeat protein